MIESAQDLFGVLVIRMSVFTSVNADGSHQGKLVTLARIHCQRKNANEKFSEFISLNSGKRLEAEFHFNSDYIG